jgi:hypothetical protein
MQMAPSTRQRVGTIKTVVSTRPYRTHYSYLKLLSGLPTDTVQIESIKVSPDPPKPGQNLTVTVNAAVTGAIEVLFPEFVGITWN